MTEPDFVPLPPRFDPGAPPEAAARAFYESLATRRTVRAYSDQPVSRETIEWIVRAAGTAPNGANKQPWRFVCVQSAEVKKKIRLAAEEEERKFYEERASERWLEDLAPLGTDDHKPYLEVAPWLIVVMRLSKTDEGGQVYYGQESVGIALGMLFAAIHRAGLVGLCHTPSPMRFLREVLERPGHEQPFALVPVGYPAADCAVPAEAIQKKPLDEIMVVV